MESEPGAASTPRTVGWVNSRGRRRPSPIAIRSAFQYGDTIYLNVSAGIVAESVPRA